MKSILSLAICLFLLLVSIIGFATAPAISQTAQELFDTANKHAQQGALEQAEESFQKAIRMDPAMAGPAYLTLATAYAKHQNPGKAVEYYEKALECNPKATMIYVNLANSYLSQGRFDKAIETYHKLTSIEPKETWPYYNLGNLYLQQQMYPEADAAFMRVVEMDPAKFPDIYEKLGYARQKALNYREAVKAYKKALERTPDSYRVNYNIGISYYYMNDLDNAIQAYEKALELKPNNPEAITNMGLAFYYKGEYETAANAFDRALNFKPDLGEALLGKAMVYEKQKEYQKAMDYTEKAVKTGKKVSQEFIDRLKTKLEEKS